MSSFTSSSDYKHGIKSRLAGAVIFISVTALMHMLLVSFMTEIKSNTLTERMQTQFDKYKGDLDYLVMGDSHMARGLNPDILGKAFNYSTLGETYYKTLSKARGLLRSGERNIGTIILPLDFHSLTETRNRRLKKKSKRTVDRLIKNYLPYANRLDIILPLMDKGNRVHSEIIKGLIVSERKFSLLSAKARGDMASSRAMGHFRPSAEILDKAMVKDLLELLDTCQKNGVEVVLVKMPVTKAYHKAASEHFDINEYQAELDVILSKHPSVHVLNYRTLFFGKNELFMNSDHLNKAGADELTLLLKKDIEALAGKKQASIETPSTDTSNKNTKNKKGER